MNSLNLQSGPSHLLSFNPTSGRVQYSTAGRIQSLDNNSYYQANYGNIVMKGWDSFSINTNQCENIYANNNVVRISVANNGNINLENNTVIKSIKVNNIPTATTTPTGYYALTYNPTNGLFCYVNPNP